MPEPTPAAPVLALCCGCGAQRTASSRYLVGHPRPLRCEVCRRATDHVPVSPVGSPDQCEDANAALPLRPYDPGADLRQNFPGWRYSRVGLADADVVFIVPAKMILIDTRFSEDAWSLRYSLAHCVARLHLGQVGNGQPFTGAETDAAADLAADRMDSFMPAEVDPHAFVHVLRSDYGIASTVIS